MEQFIDNKEVINHDKTIKMLEAHGFGATMDTEANQGKLIMNTSFYSTFGKKESYNLRSVIKWLGY